MRLVSDRPVCFLIYHREHSEIVIDFTHSVSVTEFGDLRICRLDPAKLPPDAARRGCEINRYLDRFHLLLSREDPVLRQQTLDLFFSFLEPDYESTVDVDRNENNIKILLEVVQGALGDISQAVLLDFGCGTGLSLGPARECGTTLVGFDTSEAMRSAARSRGMSVLTAERILSSDSLRFDGIIASYVLHLEPAEVWIRAAWSHLRPGGVFAANFHKHSGLDAFTRILRNFGAGVRLVNPLEGERHGSFVLCTKM
jgi:SAM-dependent methyltransferase